MTESNRRGINVAAPICPIWAGLSPARIVAARALGRLAALKSAIRRGAYKKGGSATRTPDSNRSPFGSAKAAPLLREVLLFFRRPISKPLPPVFPLPLSQQGRGAGWDRVGTGWGYGISLYPNAERTPCFSATPSIGTQNATAAPERPPQPRSTALLSPCSSPAQPLRQSPFPRALCHCKHHPRALSAVASASHASRTPHPPFCKQSCAKIFQRNKNIILWRSNAKNSYRTPINAAKSPHLCRNPCNLQLCPRPAHTGRYNVRARESN